MRKNEDIGSLYRLYEKQKRNNFLCLFPGCTARLTRPSSHVIPESVLRLFARDGKVLRWDQPDYGAIKRSVTGNQSWETVYAEPIEIGVGETKWPLFCHDHDDGAFAPLEKPKFAMAPKQPEQLALLAYRALCYTTYNNQKRMIEEFFSWLQERGHSHPFASPEKRAELQQYLPLDPLLEARHLLGQMCKNKDYSQVDGDVFPLTNIPARIACTGPWIPLDRIEQESLLKNSLMLTPQDVTTFSVFPNNNSETSYCVISWFKGSQRGESYRDMLHQLSGHEQEKNLLFTAFQQPNICISPGWWDSLSEEEKQRYRNLYLRNAVQFRKFLA